MNDRFTTTLALDVGNVCCRIAPERCLAALQLTPPELPRLLAAVHEYECGRLNDAGFYAAAAAATGGRFSRAELERAFLAILTEPVPGMAELLAEFPALGVRAVLFSDISPIHLAEVLKLMPAAALAADGVYSYTAGDTKPGEKMFAAFERKFGVPDLYVDDRADLVSAASARGWNAQVFTGAAQLRQLLTETAACR